MDSKTLLKVIKKVVNEEVRKVIKEELSEILQEGLRSTVNEMSLTEETSNVEAKPKKRNIEFKKNKFSDILNETDSLREQSPYGSSGTVMNEDIMMTSANAQGFGAMREKMRSAISGIPANDVVTDAQTGQVIQVEDPAIAKAMTRDYSALMRAMDKKKHK